MMAHGRMAGNVGLLLGAFVVAAAAPPTPTMRQQQYLDMAFTQFMHFSVTTFGNIEHDCVNGKCLPVSMFNPTNVDTDQWVLTAKAMGAGEICLTAHHEGGFCLWPSKFSNYTVRESPYQEDILAKFVASCRKYGVRPCFYIGPNANGYFTQVLKLTPADFIQRQLGMIEEVLTEYGFISRLWWDHYLAGCGGLSECPGGFPQGWRYFTNLVRELSPDTLLGTGPDVGHAANGESGNGSYPLWNSCVLNGTDPTQKCLSYGPNGTLFRPQEADATIQNPGDAWFWKKDHKFWTAADIWTHYFMTIGRGTTFILNMPPNTTGLIPEEYVAEATKFGDALRQTFSVPVGIWDRPITVNCSDSIVLEASGDTFDMVVLREDMFASGQRIEEYAFDVFENGTWRNIQEGVHGMTVGNMVVDFIPATNAEKVRFRCMRAVMDPITLRSFALYKAYPPA